MAERVLGRQDLIFAARGTVVHMWSMAYGSGEDRVNGRVVFTPVHSFFTIPSFTFSFYLALSLRSSLSLSLCPIISAPRAIMYSS